MKKKTGISLIVLVITIIVMIILAASVMITISNTGIIDKASTAKDNMESATLKQELEMALAFQAGNMGDLSETLKDVEGIQNTAVKKVEADGTEVVMTDMTYISRGNTTYTIYNGKELVEGKIEVWNKKVNSKAPAATSENDKVIHIYSAEELKWIADQVNAGTNTFEGWTIYLESDVDFGARPEGDNWETTANENRKWDPIGVAAANPFKGTFDGKGHTIRGMYVNLAANFGAFIGNGYSVKNLTVKNSYAKAVNCAAGIMGSTRAVGTTPAIIENCHNVNTTVIATGSTAAGIISQIYDGDTITKCSNSGTIKATGNFSGGIVGLAQTNTKITHNSNSGKIVGDALAVAGIAGAANSNSLLENNSNSGKVTGNDYVGGIVGNSNTAVTINNNINTASVNAANGAVAGIVGVASNSGIVSNNRNTGSIETATKWVGGIIGAGMDNLTVINNINDGSVTAPDTIAGGIAFQLGSGSNVANNINNGTIKTGSQYAAGIVTMLNYNSNVTNNINNGKVIAGGYAAGGIITSIDSTQGISKVSGNVNNGTVQGEQKWIGGILAISNVTDSGTVDVINLEVSNNINNGNIRTEKGAFRVAGIVGNCNASTVLFNNINRGNIDGYGNMNAAESYAAGGIVGTKGAYVYIYNCFNTGSVKSKKWAGGIVGNIYPVGEDENDVLESYDGEYIKGVYNTGTVEAVEGPAGGILGSYDTRGELVTGLVKQITNAYNLGEIKGLDSAGLVGGLAGVKNSINMGAVTGTNKYGVIANKLATTEISNVYYLSGVPSDVGTAMDRASMTNTFMQGVLGTELFNYSSSTPQLYKINVEYTTSGITKVTATNEILK